VVLTVQIADALACSVRRKDAQKGLHAALSLAGTIPKFHLAPTLRCRLNQMVGVYLL